MTQTGTVVHLALYYSTIHGADGVYKAARPKTAAATPPRAYFGAPVGIAPESDSDSDEEELLSAPAAPPANLLVLHCVSGLWILTSAARHGRSHRRGHALGAGANRAIRECVNHHWYTGA